MTRRIFFVKLSIICVAISSLFAACSSDATSDLESTNIYITLSAITFDADEGVASFSLTTPYSWELTSNRDWLSASPDSGVGDATITLSAEANETNLERIAQLQMSLYDSYGSASDQFIYIYQTAAEEDELELEQESDAEPNSELELEPESESESEPESESESESESELEPTTITAEQLVESTDAKSPAQDYTIGLIAFEWVTASTISSYTGGSIRIYSGSTVTISTTNEALINTIEIEFSSSYNDLSASCGELTINDNLGVWVGSASSVTFTAGASRAYIVSFSIE